MNIIASREEHAEEYRYNLTETAQAIYEFSMRYSDKVCRARDYGNGDPISGVEVHILTTIIDHPGITVSGLAQMWKRTRGTVSLNVSSLEKRGYIRRERDSGEKVVRLYGTDSGEKLSRAQKDFDRKALIQTRQVLMRTCSEQDLIGFQKVIHAYLELLEGRPHPTEEK